MESTGDALHILRASNMNMNTNAVYGILPLNHSLLGHPDLNERRIYGDFFLKRETHPLETEKLLNQMFFFFERKDYDFSKGFVSPTIPMADYPGINGPLDFLGHHFPRFGPLFFRIAPPQIGNLYIGDFVLYNYIH